MRARFGKIAALVSPLVEAVAQHVMAAEKLHANDTPVPVLAPGTGKTKTGRLWVYLRDERPYRGEAPPAVVYRYSPDRKGEHPRAQLAKFRGFLQADGYSGFGPLYETATGASATVTEVACWAHVRRKFYDIHVATNAPIAGDALTRIGQLFDVERAAIGPLAARATTHSRWSALTRYLDFPQVELRRLHLTNGARGKVRIETAAHCGRTMRRKRSIAAAWAPDLGAGLSKARCLLHWVQHGVEHELLELDDSCPGAAASFPPSVRVKS
jgi:hypothetical protein